MNYEIRVFENKSLAVHGNFSKRQIDIMNDTKVLSDSDVSVIMLGKPFHKSIGNLDIIILQVN